MASKRRAKGGSKSKAASPKASPLERADPKQIREEARALRELLASTLPAFARSREEIGLGADESPLIRAFWETLGWSPIFAARLAHPGRERGAARARQIMTEFVKEGSTDLRVNDLPRKLRLVSEDSQGVGFEFTDEDVSLNDPPVLGIAAELSTVRRANSSYLRYCAAELSGLVFRRWYDCTLSLPAGERIPGDGVLRNLCPDLKRLSDDLWLPGSAQNAEKRRGTMVNVAFRTSAAILDWIRKHAHMPTGYLGLAFIEVKIPAADRQQLIAALSAQLTETADGWYAVGEFLGQPVLVCPGAHIPLGLYVGWREWHAIVAAAEEQPTLSAYGRVLAERLRPKPVSEVERPPPLAIGLDEHRRQAREFAAWVEELAPEHRAGKRPVAIEPEAPGAVAALWHELGVSDVVREARTCPPDRRSAHAVATRALARWFEDAITRDVWNLAPNGSIAPEAWLPPGFRLVDAYVPSLKYDYLVPKSSYLDVTDETSDTVDPPIFRVGTGNPKPVKLSSSYVQYVTSVVATNLAQSRSAHALSDAFAERGVRICEPWFDGLYRLNPGFWFWCRRRSRLVSETAETIDKRFLSLFLFQNTKTYLEFCDTLTDSELAQTGPPRGSPLLLLNKAQRFKPEAFEASGFRCVRRALLPPEHTRNEWIVVGRMSQHPVYITVTRISQKTTTYRLYCSLETIEAIRSWLTKEKIGIAKEDLTRK
jgi:hypothetical protein